VLDIKEQKLTIEGLVKKLTIKETKLICMLVQNANTITKRENILINLWGKNDYFLGRSLDVFISKLRKYFRADPTVKIENIRGVGFKLVITDSES
jgi:DNA-binding response OmpR family regulator